MLWLCKPWSEPHILCSWFEVLTKSHEPKTLTSDWFWFQYKHVVVHLAKRNRRDHWPDLEKTIIRATEFLQGIFASNLFISLLQFNNIVPAKQLAKSKFPTARSYMILCLDECIHQKFSFKILPCIYTVVSIVIHFSSQLAMMVTLGCLEEVTQMEPWRFALTAFGA